MWQVSVVIRRYIDILIIIINFPYSTCTRSFLAAVSLLLCSFLNVFSVLFPLFFFIIASEASSVTNCANLRFLVYKIYLYIYWRAELSVELSDFSLYLYIIIYIYIFIYNIYIYLFIYFRPYVVHVPLTRYAQTSDRPVEVQRSI